MIAFVSILFLSLIIYLTIYKKSKKEFSVDFNLSNITIANRRLAKISAKKNFFDKSLITTKDFFEKNLIVDGVVTTGLRITTAEKNFFESGLITTGLRITTTKKNFFKNDLITENNSVADFRYLLSQIILFFDWLTNKTKRSNKSTFATFLYSLTRSITFFSSKKFRYALCFES